MTAAGLGNVDIMRRETLGGMTLDFFKRAAERPDGEIYHVTPAASEQIFDNMAETAAVKVLKRARISEQVKPQMSDGRIEAVTLENGDTVHGKIFIDATYEGDLMAAAGVSYRVGREGRDEYGEPAAGIRPASEIKYAEPFDENGNLRPDLVRADFGKVGDADGLTQAYNFRVCMTQNKKNFVSMPKPEGYNPEDYRNLLNMINTHPRENWTFNDIISYWGLLPDGKIDVNNRGDYSSDMVNHSHTWAEASYAERDAVFEAHKRYIQGLIYFISNDPRVPEQLRKDSASWGLPADEFTDNGNWPWQIYVREARRMVGEHVMRQQDCYEDNLKPDSIGLGSYMLDSHAVRRFLAPDGKVYIEGGISAFDGKVPVRPYEIPYRSLTPKKSECANLLVTTCLSSSHVAYCSLRMEPQFMTAGEAAGVAAAMAIDSGVPVQDIDVKALQQKLEALGGVLHYPGGNLFPRSAELEAQGYYVLNETDAKLTGPWQSREVGTPMLDGRYLQSYNADPVTATYTWTVPEDGRYVFYLLVPHGEARMRMPVVFTKNGFSYKLSCDLADTGKGLLDEMHRFIAKKGDTVTVVLGNGGRDVRAAADGVVFEKIK